MQEVGGIPVSERQIPRVLGPVGEPAMEMQQHESPSPLEIFQTLADTKLFTDQ
jgi:hypothetical protein